MRREPLAFFAWTLMWVVVLLLTAVIVATGPKVVVGGHNDLLGLITHYGVRAFLIVPILLAAWAVTTTAICRAVFIPDEKAIFHLKIGIAELRVAAIHVVTVIVTPVVVAAILAGGGLVAQPFFNAAPTMASEIGGVGLFATVCLSLWLYVRLSLIPIETFAEGRIHLTAYWPLTRGRFWYLFLAYSFVGLIVIVLAFVVAWLAVLGFGAEALGLAQSQGTLSRGQAITAIAILLAVSTVSFVFPYFLVCSCQAYAYRVIAGAGDGLMAGVNEA